MAGNRVPPGATYGYPTSQQYPASQYLDECRNGLSTDLSGAHAPSVPTWHDCSFGLGPYGSNSRAAVETFNLTNPSLVSCHQGSSNPNLSQALVHNPLQMPSSGTAETDTPAYQMRRFCVDEGPWNPQRVSGGMPEAYYPQTSSAIPYSGYLPNLFFNGYSAALASEPESNATGNFFSDSGYGTKSFSTVSVLSNEPTEPHRGGSSLSHQLRNIQPFASQTNQTQITGQVTESLDTQKEPNNSAKSPKRMYLHPSFQCKYCERSFRVRSELKKHVLKHEKKYKCGEPNCKRTEGFSTPNDLERHKKTVHHILSPDSTAKIYQCFAEDCKHPKKVWHRPDNFRAHIRRVHGEERLNELFNRGECNALPSKANISTDTSMINQSDRHDERSDAPSSGGTGMWPRGIAMNESRDRHQNRSSEMPRIYSYDNDREETTGRHRANSNSYRQNLPAVAESVYRQDTQSRGSQLVYDELASMVAELLRAGVPSERNIIRLLRVLQETREDRRSLLSSSYPTIIGPRFRQDTQSLKSPFRATQSSTEGPNNTPDMESRPGSVLRASLTGTGKEAHHPGVTQTFIHKCCGCLKQFSRIRELRNHHKYHRKPYRCTFLDCSSAFKSKEKWRAHENDEHWQSPCYRCRLPKSQSSSSSKEGENDHEECAKLLYSPHLFRQHLQNKHKITSLDTINEEKRACLIGDKGSHSFWCGFCRAIKPLFTADFAAWDERLDHLQTHIDGEGLLMDEWVPMNDTRTKREIFAQSSDVESDEDSDDDSLTTFIPRQAPSSRAPTNSGNGETTTRSCIAKRRHDSENGNPEKRLRWNF